MDPIEAYKTEFAALCKKHGMVPVARGDGLHFYTRAEQEAIPGVQSFDQLIDSFLK